ncbi:ring-cleaving dioxygenase [Thermodesulfobacteriota bacterium]
MSEDILGIHHITAIAGEPQRNLDFYAGVLGLRLVKQTVNFDEPTTYHLYYGDESGNPGTIMTFFPWPGGTKGRRGPGQATTVKFSVPEGSLPYWVERLRKNAVSFSSPSIFIGEEFISLADPDGLTLQMVARKDTLPESFNRNGPIPPEYAVSGFHLVTLSVSPNADTIDFLEDFLGIRPVALEKGRTRLEVGEMGGSGTFVDIESTADSQVGLVAVGSIHHVAWRVENDKSQRMWRGVLTKRGVSVKPIRDRRYFGSSGICFHEPGNVLFEIATDPPGFGIDEGFRELGDHLMLPSWLESKRQSIQRALPPLDVSATNLSWKRQSDFGLQRRTSTG